MSVAFRMEIHNRDGSTMTIETDHDEPTSLEYMRQITRDIGLFWHVKKVDLYVENFAGRWSLD